MARDFSRAEPLPVAFKVIRAMPPTTSTPAPEMLPASSSPEGAREMSVTRVALLTALVGTIAFYLPLFSMLQPDKVAWPAFMLTHDQRTAYFLIS
jgi:hypothetical protein